ncbi:hypothetical protein QOZ80_5BG0428050 [Eleusine coracana subsp. coracana]|nr:hypothetical protein QOZ80_5BG0428050 [Eleusine coracana subsp. coracana]
MLQEKNQEEYTGEDMDDGGEYEDYDDDYAEEDGVDTGEDHEMIDGFVNGEEDRKFKSKVWDEFIKIRVAGIVVKGQCKHCQALITTKHGAGTSVMLTHLRRFSYYPTANLHFHEVWEVKMALENDISELDVDLVETIEYMVRKFKKYWKLTWLQISVPVLFDPRFKLPFIEFRLNKAFGSEATSKIATVKKVFMGLFQDYSQQNTDNQEASQAVVQEELTHASGRYADWDTYVSMNAETTNVVPSEVETYLAKAPIPRGENFNIIAWWKSNSLEFPVLSRIARDILVVPASTVASESAFSTGGRVISDFRSHLKPETVEALICLQD